MPLHAIMADLLKHHLNNVECQFMSKGIRHYPLQTYFILKKIRKIVVVVVHYETRSLNTLSGNGHNYYIIYVALKHYVYMRFIFIKSCLNKHSMYMRIVKI